jgi:hypothetical protein
VLQQAARIVIDTLEIDHSIGRCALQKKCPESGDPAAKQQQKSDPPQSTRLHSQYGLDSGRESRFNHRKLGADRGSNCPHAGNSAKGDQCNNQSVFNQILTFLATHQILELHIQPEKHGVYLCPLLLL